MPNKYFVWEAHTELYQGSRWPWSLSHMNRRHETAEHLLHPEWIIHTAVYWVSDCMAEFGMRFQVILDDIYMEF